MSEGRTSRTRIMGILNVTPDSFSGDGVFGDHGRAADLAAGMVAAGADIIDIGGESTRPGYGAISVAEELRRAIPAIRAVRGRVSVPISIDTRKANVALSAIDAGASIINDVSGLSGPGMASVAAETGARLVLVHNRPVTGDLMDSILQGIREMIGRAVAAGVQHENIIVDPGLGFNKGWEQNLAIIHRLGALQEFGHPILVGPSRKGTIGKVLGVGVHDRREGTIALATAAIAAGARIIRVHDVRELSRAAKIVDALTCA